jgi:hypothetical protein
MASLAIHMKILLFGCVAPTTKDMLKLQVEDHDLDNFMVPNPTSCITKMFIVG